MVTRPVPLLGLVIHVAALWLPTLLHEVAHGLTLTRFGGRPRRAGFMLFSLTPAFFVEVVALLAGGASFMKRDVK